MNKHSILLRIIIFFFLALVATTALFKVIVVDNPKLYKEIQERKKFDTVSCANCNSHLNEQELGEILLKDVNTKDSNVDYVWWLYISFIIIMLLLFLSIAISLYPLKHLQVQIQQFGEGDLDVDFHSDKKDEIADVANEFNNSAKKIKNILQARIVFLRNITHECKTPITSGKLALEFIEESKSKDVLRNVFTKLELLLKEFVHIEQITATEQKLDKKSYVLIDVLDQASDLLFIEQNSVKNNFSDKKIKVNFEFFTIVFKNLIDNAIKYSKNNDFYIECKEDGIYFCSLNEPMDESLDYYLQPFTTTNTKSAESFGLGLYIVDALLKKHNFTLKYKYLNGYNCFIIKM